ncbi:MAG TPA: thioredoxin family protein [Pelolinea sp.]|nr:thioredoxin family protein [Pelolinea sp.]
MVEIKVLGPGCANCKRLEQIARKAVDKLAANANIEKVTDYQEIVELGVMSTPGLVVNGEVVSSGRIPSETEVTEWISKAIESN